ncbi:spore photoproduct lyase [Rubeoparvulum massiliense]|uniref:spore photoproduct lyase n=1 Tax=Rubeoparvulum massiliense TaxID=1631346 RepID=UPI000AD51EA2|nr:spore photoproduct lyase [Rubeoparvulum massiliense]
MRLPFQPDRVFFEPASLEYPLGKELYQYFRKLNIPIQKTTSHNQVRGIPGETELEQYRNAKRTLVIGVRHTLKFEPSLPSAEYALPLATGCMGHCHYCYLQSTMGKKPYLRIYVNTDEILEQAAKYINERAPEVTRFEAACTSDPLSLEHLTGNLAKAIQFFAEQPLGRLRFVTKYHWVEPLLRIEHQGHTRFRFSMNAATITKQFEPNTSSLEQRIAAANQVAQAGYPLGFIIAPIFRFPEWRDAYTEMFEKMAEQLQAQVVEPITFELISHRYTMTAKNIILQHYPRTSLEMNEEEREKKWGRYGRVKYMYPKQDLHELEEFFRGQIQAYFPEAVTEYFT